MNYECPRCGSLDFAIDIIENGLQGYIYDIMCRNCGGYQGEMDVNKNIGNSYRLVA